MNLVNAVLFKANWFACVLGGTFWGALGITGLLAFSVVRNTWRQDLALLALLAGVGALLDTTWIHLGILDYGTVFAPIWIIFLWMGLAMTLNHAMSLFQQRPLLGAILSGAAAPVTYLGGQSLGAVSVPTPELLGIVAVVWAGLFYALFRYLGSRATTAAGDSHAY